MQNAYGGVVSNAVVVAVDGNGNPQATTVTDQNGNFLLDTLVAGTYNLVIYNAYVTASGWAVNAVNSDSTGTVQAGSAGVSPGQNTSVGTIQD